MKKNNTLLALLAIALLLFLAVSSFTYAKSVEQHTATNVITRLEEITQTNVVSFNLQIEEQIKKVNTLADYLGYQEPLGTPDHIHLLQSTVSNNGLLRCAISFPDGHFITHDSKNEGNVSDSYFFTEGMKGNFSITDPQPAVVDTSKTVILFSAPIWQDEEIIGVLTYSYLCDDLDQLFNLSFMEETGNILIAKQTGDLLIGETPNIPARSNVLDYLKSNCLHKDHSAEDCAKLESDTGLLSIQLKDSKESLWISYNKLPFNDWYMFSLVSKDAATKTILNISNEQRYLGILILGCLVFYSSVALILWIRTRNNVDKLSGAPTFEKFKRLAKKVVKKNPTQRYVMVKLDVRNFKLINRIYSFDEGDRVIKNISSSLNSVLADYKGIYARVGTDDFVILLPFIDSEALSETRAAFIALFRELMGTQFSTNVDFPTGQYVTSPQDSLKPDIGEIYEKVNFAHRAAKQRLSSAIVDYEQTIENDALFQQEIEDAMENALSNDEFSLFLQPKYSTVNEKICGAEALVRWVINGRMIMHPTNFVPVFEKNGFIVKIDMYMFRQTCIFLHELMERGETPLVISVNFSRYHLRNDRFVEELCSIADEYNVPHKYLEVELTETIVYENVEYIVKILNQLHEKEFTLSLDDFGSGYSSLGLLKDLEVDVIKIDKSFFGDFFHTDRARTVVYNIIRMAKELHIKTVAEGVETKEIVEVLQEMHCDLIQGYYYSKPKASKELFPVENMLK